MKTTVVIWVHLLSVEGIMPTTVEEVERRHRITTINRACFESPRSGRGGKKTSNHNSIDTLMEYAGSGRGGKKTSNHNFAPTQSIATRSGRGGKKTSNHNRVAPWPMSHVVEEVERRHRITTDSRRAWRRCEWKRWKEDIESQHRGLRAAARRSGRGGKKTSNHNCLGVASGGNGVEEVERRHRIPPLNSNQETRKVISTTRVPAFKCQRSAVRKRLPERRLPVNNL